MRESHNKHLCTSSNCAWKEWPSALALLPPRLHVWLQVHIHAEQFKKLFKRGAKLHSLLQPCVSVCCCVCAGWCNNLCSFPHYTVLHRSKWVLSMFLHLNYTTEIIGSGVAEEEEECRGSSSTELRDQTLSSWHLVTSSCLVRCNMAITIYKLLVFLKSPRINVCWYSD